LSALNYHKNAKGIYKVGKKWYTQHHNPKGSVDTTSEEIKDEIEEQISLAYNASDSDHAVDAIRHTIGEARERIAFNALEQSLRDSIERSVRGIWIDELDSIA
jgi:hypothetical protein